MYSLRTFSSPLSETIIHYLRCWNSTFQKRISFLFFSIKEKLRFYSTQTLNVSLCTRALFFFFCSPRSPLSSAGTVDPYIDASREKNLFLPALDVQIGEKSTYTQHAQRRTTHTHTHTEPTATAYPSARRDFISSRARLSSWLSAGHHSTSSLTKKEGKENLGS